MSRRLLSLLGVLLVGALGGAARSSALHAPAAAKVTPHRFGSCPALVGYARANLARTNGLPEPPIEAVAVATATTAARGAAPAAPSAAAATGGDNGAAAAPAYSTTNNQEEGVDEPDMVKTDGSTLFVVAGNKLEAVSVAGATPQLASTLDLGPNGYNAQLLLRGNRLIVVSTQIPVVPLPAGPIAAARASLRASPYFLYGSTTQLSEVDVSNPAAMKVTQTLTVDGRFVDARQAGSSARIVLSSAPHAILEPQLADASAGWVPTWKFQDRRTGRRFVRPVAACSSIRRPADFSGLGMLSIVTVDFDKGLGAAHTDALMADAQIVYGSQSSLYVATQKWVNPQLPLQQLPSGQSTVIDRFDLSDPDATRFVASGEVPGYLLNQFSLSELDGYLRVASTSRPLWWGGVGIVPGTVPQSQSYVTVLKTDGSVLAPVGQVSGLGQGERITSVRFIGDMGYVVTFRQVDPLYTIDLGTPTAPKVAGQLDLAGYSAYLHPVGAGLLLGVGTDVSSSNEPDGSQLELFDVSDAAAPKLLAKTLIGTGSSTQVTSDHHAFLFWPPTSLAVLPVQVGAACCIATPGGVVPPTTDQFSGAIGYKVTSAGISEVGRVVQDAVNGATPLIERSVVVGDRLYTISPSGVLASGLTTLARQAFVSFPAS